MSHERSQLGFMTRKARSANLTREERNLLVNLVVSQFTVIENKQTGSVSSAEKNHAWGVLTSQFNTRSGNPDRSRENLKSAWENMKRAARRRVPTGRRRAGEDTGFPSHRKGTVDPLLKRIATLIQPSAAVKMHKTSSSVDESLDDDSLSYAATERDEGDDTEVGNCEMEDSESDDGGDADAYYHDLCRTITGPENDGLSNIKVERVESVETVEVPSRGQTESLQGIDDAVSAEGSTIEKAKLQLLNKQYQLAVQQSEEIAEINKVRLEIEKEKLTQEKVRTKLLLHQLNSITHLNKSSH